jgi:hypothetical protein
MRTTVLIVSKTNMKAGVCVGAIAEDSLELVRLRNERGGNLGYDSPYEVGDRWEVDLQTAWNVRSAPHIEDKQTSPLRKVNNVGVRGIIDFIKRHNDNLRYTHGNLRDCFEGALNFLGDKNFVDRNNIPPFSTQFWMTDCELRHVAIYDKDYYEYGNIRIKYVGCQDPTDRIPAGTIIRLSLANWWNGDGSGEDRCYLQLSGWYMI